jgi:hypothetical protein
MVVWGEQRGCRSYSSPPSLGGATGWRTHHTGGKRGGRSGHGRAATGDCSGGDTEGPTGGETSSIHPTSDPMGTGSSEGVTVIGVGLGVADGTGPGSSRTCADILAAAAVRATLPVALGLWAAWLAAVKGPVDPLAGAPGGIGTSGPTSTPGRERLLSEEPGAAVASHVVVGRLRARPIMGGPRTAGPVTPEANANPAVASSRTLEADCGWCDTEGLTGRESSSICPFSDPVGTGARGGVAVSIEGAADGTMLGSTWTCVDISVAAAEVLTARCVMAYRSQFVPAEIAVVGGGAFEGAPLTGLVCRARAQAPAGRLAGSCVAVVRELGVSVRFLPFGFLSIAGLCSGPIVLRQLVVDPHCRLSGDGVTRECSNRNLGACQGCTESLDR